MDPTADRATVLRHLELANRHVAKAALLDELGRDGHDTVQANGLIELLRSALALQIEDRDRILEGTWREKRNLVTPI
jgi:hypothetical protein